MGKQTFGPEIGPGETFRGNFLKSQVLMQKVLIGEVMKWWDLKIKIMEYTVHEQEREHSMYSYE